MNSAEHSGHRRELAQETERVLARLLVGLFRADRAS